MIDSRRLTIFCIRNITCLSRNLEGPWCNLNDHGKSVPFFLTIRVSVKTEEQCPDENEWNKGSQHNWVHRL